MISQLSQHLIAAAIKIPDSCRLIFPANNYAGTLLLTKLVRQALNEELLQPDAGFSGQLNACFTILYVRNTRKGLVLLEELLTELNLIDNAQLAWFDRAEWIYRPHGPLREWFEEFFHGDNLSQKIARELSFAEAILKQP